MALAPAINEYLAGRGSPMAGLGSAFVRAGRRFDIDPRLLVGIATIESGAGAKTRNRNNPFNWGVHRGQEYDSMEESIYDVARGLRQNYLNHGLETPEQIVSKYAPASDGNDEGNWASVVNQVIGQLGGGAAGAVKKRTLAALTPPPALPPTPKRRFDPQAFGHSLVASIAANEGRTDFAALPGLMSQAWETVPPPPAPARPARPTRGAPTPAQGGPGIQLPASFRATHQTDNLGWDAVDLMGDPGTPVRTPVAGVIVRHGSAQGGGALYLDTNGDGQGDYWLGHVTEMLPVGTAVEPGQVIAAVSPDHPRPHAHWAKR